VADPRDPQRLRPAFDSGDHLDPNDAGYHAMADAVTSQCCCKQRTADPSRNGSPSLPR
jgi:hypothetical protein